MKAFFNGKFISCAEPNSIFSVLVEDKGRIVFTGDELPAEYEAVEKEDLKSACVVPSFADTHIHFESYAFFHGGLDVRNAASFEELGETIKGYQSVRPGEKFTLGFGCSAHTVKEFRLPERKDLDAFASRPLMIIKYDGHAAVANSALIKKMPKNVLSARGFEPETGWFYLDSFYAAVNHITGSVSPVTVFRNLAGAADFMAKKGVSSIHTVEGVGFPLDIDIDILRLASHGLPQRFRIFFQTMEVKKVLRRKLGCIGGCFATALDGCLGSVDAALREPYSDNPGSRGTLFYPQETVNEFTRKANRAGLQIAVHAVGDAAVEQALLAFEHALKDFPREDHRHTIIHADLMDESQLARAASMGLSIAVQTPFLYWDQEPMEYLQRILGERAGNLIPVKSMLKSGIVVTNGSDAPTTIPDPLWCIHTAVNHPNPDERIPVIDALKMVTSNAARVAFEEKDAGTLETGKRADFAVLDRDILSVPPEQIKGASVVGHYIGGERYSGMERGAFSLFVNSIWNGLFN